MKVQLVYFRGCPNVDAARDAVHEALADAGLALDVEEVDTASPETPASLQKWGSPTILIDGVDIAGEPEPTGASCRLYDNPENRGVPSRASLVAALRRNR